MKIVILNKSDATGGAAVVSRRLMEALRQEGEDARMLVCEKLTNSSYIELAEKPRIIKLKFLLERLKIFFANGFNRSTLFKIDTGEEGLPLWKHPLVEKADAILIGWVNQGMLSLDGVKKILMLGKPVIWTMHDMWCMTGICHHAGPCNHYQDECGNCPLLFKLASSHDLSFKIWRRKNQLINKSGLNKRLAFVAVSNWLRRKTSESSLLKNQMLEVIATPFRFPVKNIQSPSSVSPVRLLFSAARLDDPIKGIETLRESTKILKEKYPKIAKNMELVLAGGVKDPETFEGFALPLVKLGLLHGEEAVRKAYEGVRIVISVSSYETFGCTLMEAQAYGCIPVSFSQGGQVDIIDHGKTGFLAKYDQDLNKRARNLTEGIVKAYETAINEKLYMKMIERMQKNVDERFSYKVIASKYIALIQKLSDID